MVCPVVLVPESRLDALESAVCASLGPAAIAVTIDQEREVTASSTAMTRIALAHDAHLALGGLLLALAIPSCASDSVGSGAAVGKLGSSLSAHTRSVPQGAEACALEGALTASTPGAPDKPPSETCAKALNSDHLWRKAMIVLSAYSSRLEALASGAKPESAGQIEAMLTGVRGADWIQAEAGEETSAREAAVKLVDQMTAKDEKADFDKTVKDAAPYVKTLCSGIQSYLDAQAKKLGEVRQEIEKKRAAKSDRRCATFDNRTICVSESVIDRLVYANTFAGLSLQEANHLEARDDVASFCAAHAKLESAAAEGNTGKDETYTSIVEAVKAVPRAKPPTPAATAPADAGSKPKAPEKK